MGATAAGIAYLPVDRWTRAFLGMGLPFSIGSTFNLARTVRDIREAGRQIHKLDRAGEEVVPDFLRNPPQGSLGYSLKPARVLRDLQTC